MFYVSTSELCANIGLRITWQSSKVKITHSVSPSVLAALLGDGEALGNIALDNVVNNEVLEPVVLCRLPFDSGYVGGGVLILGFVVDTDPMRGVVDSFRAGWVDFFLRK